MKVGDRVEIRWSLPRYAPDYEGQEGEVMAITNSGLVYQVLVQQKDGRFAHFPVPKDCLRELTALDLLARI